MRLILGLLSLCHDYFTFSTHLSVFEFAHLALYASSGLAQVQYPGPRAPARSSESRQHSKLGRK